MIKTNGRTFNIEIIQLPLTAPAPGVAAFTIPGATTLKGYGMFSLFAFDASEVSQDLTGLLLTTTPAAAGCNKFAFMSIQALFGNGKDVVLAFSVPSANNFIFPNELILIEDCNVQFDNSSIQATTLYLLCSKIVSQ